MRVTSLALAVMLALSASAAADDSATLSRLEALEQRVKQLESEADEREQALEDERSRPRADAPRPAAAEEEGAAWAQRVRISGSGNTGFYYGQDDSVFNDRSFNVWDARFFVDAELGEDIRIGDTTLIRNAGFSFEWDLVRIGSLQNDVGDLYIELQGLGESDWANTQVGRFLMPVGEAYLRYGKGYATKPFITSAVSGPWFWDEGVKLYGRAESDRFGYIASLTDGETSFNVDSDSDKQVTLKLYANPTSWLHLSASGLRSGELGSGSSAANGSLWLGEMWARAFGSGTSVPNYIDGAAQADGPNKLDDSYLGAFDAILHDPRWGHVWLAYNLYRIDSNGPSRYNRTLHGWIAEVVMEGGLAAAVLTPFYVGFRASGLGTYDRDRGYLLDFRYGNQLGYNMRALNAYSGVLGWRLNELLRMRLEYTHQDIDLVRGAGATLGGAANDADFVAIELGARF